MVVVVVQTGGGGGGGDDDDDDDFEEASAITRCVTRTSTKHAGTPADSYLIQFL